MHMVFMQMSISKMYQNDYYFLLYFQHNGTINKHL